MSTDETYIKLRASLSAAITDLGLTATQVARVSNARSSTTVSQATLSRLLSSDPRHLKRSMRTNTQSAVVNLVAVLALVKCQSLISDTMSDAYKETILTQAIKQARL